MLITNPDTFKSEEELAESRAFGNAMPDTIPTQPKFLQADELFSEYQSNKVAFDKKYDDKLLEFEGVISEISNPWDCARIKIRVYESSYEEISCSNCPAGVDKWADEIAEISVGQKVRIKGYYNGFSSGKYQMKLYKCHIIK